MDEAEQAFRNTLENNPKSAVAAFNLGVLLLNKDIDESRRLCRRATRLRPQDDRYVYTYAYCLQQAEDLDAAIRELQNLVTAKSAYPPAYSLLIQLLLQQGRSQDALATGLEGVTNRALSPQDYQSLQQSIMAQQEV